MNVSEIEVQGVTRCGRSPVGGEVYRALSCETFARVKRLLRPSTGGRPLKTVWLNVATCVRR